MHTVVIKFIYPSTSFRLPLDEKLKLGESGVIISCLCAVVWRTYHIPRYCTRENSSPCPGTTWSQYIGRVEPSGKFSPISYKPYVCLCTARSVSVWECVDTQNTKHMTWRYPGTQKYLVPGNGYCVIVYDPQSTRTQYCSLRVPKESQN